MTSEETAKRLVEFAFFVKRSYRIASSSVRAKLTDERFRLLSSLDRSGGSLKELASRIGISASSLCIMLNKLEEEGLVIRRRDSRDRRSVRYGIDEPGRALLEAEFEARLQPLARRLDSLGLEERDRLAASLDETRRLLDRIAFDGGT